MLGGCPEQAQDLDPWGTSLTEMSQEGRGVGKLKSLSYDYSCYLICKLCTALPSVSDKEVLFPLKSQGRFRNHLSSHSTLFIDFLPCARLWGQSSVKETDVKSLLIESRAITSKVSVVTPARHRELSFPSQLLPFLMCRSQTSPSLWSMAILILIGFD